MQIPDDPADSRVSLGQRLMNVLGVFAQAAKFDSTATFVGETRAIGGTDNVQVRTLYWGLSQAIYVDQQGENAGIGYPGPDGWTFELDSEIAADAARLLDIFEGNVDAIDFVELALELPEKTPLEIPVQVQPRDSDPDPAADPPDIAPEPAR